VLLVLVLLVECQVGLLVLLILVMVLLAVLLMGFVGLPVGRSPSHRQRQ
jgi:hypothetical protein